MSAEWIEVHGSRFVTSGALGKIGPMDAIGKYLWVSDMSGDPFMHVIDLDSGKVLQSRGKRGDGPGEFKFVSRFFPNPLGSHAVLAYDPTLNRFTELTIDNSRIIVGQVSGLPEAPRPNHVALLGSSYIGSLGDSAHRWMLFDLKGKLEYIGGSLVGSDNVPLGERVKASSAIKICGTATGDRFAVVYTSAGRIDIYDSLASLITMAKVPEPSNGDFRELPDGSMRWVREQIHYVDCAAWDNAFIALYDGRVGRPGGAMRREPGLDSAGIAQLYHWDGSLLAVLKLYPAPSQLALDPVDLVLYGAVSEESAIYRYVLPSRFGASSGD